MNGSCVPPSYPCADECLSLGESGTINELGICLCSANVDPQSFCTGDCQTCRPVTTIMVDDERVVVTISNCNLDDARVVELSDVFGVNSLDVTQRNYQLISYSSSGSVDGNFPRNSEEATNAMVRISQRSTTTANARRRRSVDDSEDELNRSRRQAVLTVQSEPEIIPNPLVCIEIGDAVFFEINQDEETSFYHYPVYVKDHLINTNPQFDYGTFRRLASLLESAVNISVFVHTFTEPGVYAFTDSINAASQLLVVVIGSGTTCERNGNDFRVLPTSEQYLVQFNITTLPSVNQAPNFAAIFGLLATTLFIVTLMVLGVFIWKPQAAGIKTPNTLKPKYRRVDEPKIIYVGDDPKDLDTLEKRGIAVGASITQGAPCRHSEPFELENFNVRTFYDKLEDQNLHVSAQLSRQRADLHGFYNKILQQTESLKALASEAQVMATVDRNRQFRQENLTLSGRPEPIGSELPGSSSSNISATLLTPGYDGELVSALKQLIGQLSSSKPPAVGSKTKRRVDYLRKWTLEKNRIERELSKDEIKTITESIETEV